MYALVRALSFGNFLKNKENKNLGAVLPDSTPFAFARSFVRLSFDQYLISINNQQSTFNKKILNRKDFEVKFWSFLPNFQKNWIGKSNFDDGTHSMINYTFLNEINVKKPMSVQVEIRVKRADKVYREGEHVDGVVRVTSPSDFKHDGISLTMDGVVGMLQSAKNTGVLDAFYNSIRPVQLVNAVTEICPSKKMPAGTTEIPFEIPLIPRPHQTILETYHGVFINIQYVLKCELKRSFLSKDVTNSLEFIVEYRKKDPNDVNFWKKVQQSAVKFSIVPENLRGYQDADMPVPNFSITGNMHTTLCDITKPFTGDLYVKRSDVPVKSIELQLVRVETTGCAEGFAREATEVQNIQIADGDVARGLKIPIYMVFPRLFSCPTLLRPNFKIEFEVNLVIIFSEKHLVTENFPIVIFRP